jgi:hypothetical protein
MIFLTSSAHLGLSLPGKLKALSSIEGLESKASPAF